MPHFNLALLGFGNVGQALARLLLEKQAELHTRYHITFAVSGIATARHGMAIDHDGIDLRRALAVMAAGESLDALSMFARGGLPSPPPSTFARGGLSSPPPPAGLDSPAGAFASSEGASSARESDIAMEFIRNCRADVLFESIPVDYQTGQPAVDFLRAALEQGMHIITAFRETLPAVRLLAFRGILNSTTNLILTRMENGESFEQAVAYAQTIGIAETDPSGDLDGWDAAVKVAALVTVLMEIPLEPVEVSREGIRNITPLEIARAREQGKRWKLVCAARSEGESVTARVAPEMVGTASPLYGVEGTSSIVQFETDVLSSLTIVESDAGPRTTAYGMLADFINAVKD